MNVIIIILLICLGLEIVAVERNIETTNRFIEDIKDRLDKIIQIISNKKD